MATASISVSHQLRKSVSLDIMTFRKVIQKMNFYLKWSLGFRMIGSFLAFLMWKFFLCEHVQSAIYKNIFLRFYDHLDCISMYIPFCCLLRIAVLLQINLMDWNSRHNQEYWLMAVCSKAFWSKKRLISKSILKHL